MRERAEGGGKREGRRGCVRGREGREGAREGPRGAARSGREELAVGGARIWRAGAAGAWGRRPLVGGSGAAGPGVRERSPLGTGPCPGMCPPSGLEWAAEKHRYLRLSGAVGGGRSPWHRHHGS